MKNPSRAYRQLAQAWVARHAENPLGVRLCVTRRKMDLLPATMIPQWSWAKPQVRHRSRSGRTRPPPSPTPRPSLQTQASTISFACVVLALDFGLRVWAPVHAATSIRTPSAALQDALALAPATTLTTNDMQRSETLSSRSPTCQHRPNHARLEDRLKSTALDLQSRGLHPPLGLRRNHNTHGLREPRSSLHSKSNASTVRGGLIDEHDHHVTVFRESPSTTSAALYQPEAFEPRVPRLRREPPSQAEKLFSQLDANSGKPANVDAWFTRAAYFDLLVRSNNQHFCFLWIGVELMASQRNGKRNASRSEASGFFPLRMPLLPTTFW